MINFWAAICLFSSKTRTKYMPLGNPSQLIGRLAIVP
jgi:hypothetical protein